MMKFLVHAAHRTAQYVSTCGFAVIFLVYVVHSTQAQQPAPQVSVAVPLAKKIIKWDEFSGRFEAIESVDVRPRVSGFVEKIHFNDGQIVKAGAPLFTIDKRPFEIAVSRARAAIEQRKAEVSLQKAEVERARPLVKSRTLALRDFETRESRLAVARANLASAEADLQAAELDLEWATVTAPISGRISDRKIDIGALVAGGSAGATILSTIVSLDPIYFEFDASESDFLRYVRAAKGGTRPSSRETDNPVRIKLADEDKWLRTGRMNFVDNRLDSRSGTIRARAIVDNTDHFLAPGLFARMQLFGGQIDALMVPDKAIVSDQTRKILFVVDDKNSVVAKPVVLGPLWKDGLRAIESGVSAEDKIVIEGIANPAVRPGAKVDPKLVAINPPKDGEQ